jgi:hypothetical protein
VKAKDLPGFQLEQRVDEGKVMAHGRRALLIDPAVFDALHLELAGFLGEDEARGTLSRLGYAMGHNAARRLRYYYGEQCSLIIESELGSGTTVCLLLPFNGVPDT